MHQIKSQFKGTREGEGGVKQQVLNLHKFGCRAVCKTWCLDCSRKWFLTIKQC